MYNSGGSQVIEFRTYLVRSSAANKIFPDAYDFNLRSTECEGICNLMWISDSVIPRDRVYLIMNNSKNRLIICGGLTTMPYKIKKKWSKSRISYYSNSVAFFNHMELCIVLSGDIHPLPGPDSISKISISVSITRRYNRPVIRRRNTSNCISIKTITTNVWHSNSIRDTTNMMCLCLLNVRSINNKAMAAKDLVVDHAVDILAMTETWLRAGNHDGIVMGTLCPNGYPG